MNTENIRKIVLDTETTGMNKKGLIYEGHNIIEIGAVEIINRKLTNNNFHVYLKPERLVELEAFNIHGISDEFLFDKPTFKQIEKEFLDYIFGAELIIHNAIFDVSFLNHELNKTNDNIKINNFCKVTDSLLIARKMFPNKRNNLDALCVRFNIDNSKRKIHSALLDAKILAKVFLLMTINQNKLSLSIKKQCLKKNYIIDNTNNISNKIHKPLLILKANKHEIIEHEKFLDLIFQKNKKCIWRN